MAGLVAVALLAVSVAPASAHWSSPTDLSSPGSGARASQVAVSPTGDSYFTWIRRHDGGQGRIQARVRSASGEWSPIVNVSGPKWEPADSGPAIAASQGHAVIVWLRGSRILARSLSAHGTVEWARKVSPRWVRADGDPKVALDDQGNAAITWWRWFPHSATGVQARWVSANGDKRPLETISDSGSAFTPKVVVTPEDRALITWNEWDHGTMARSLFPNGTLTPTDRVSQPTDGTVTTAEPAVDDTGRAAFLWGREDPDGEDWTIYVRLGSLSGDWGPIEAVSPPPDWFELRGIAFDGSGNAVAAWVGYENHDFTLRTRRVAPSSALSPTRVVTDFGNSLPGDPESGFAMGAGDDAHFVWVTSPASGQVRTRSVTADGTLSPTQTISTMGEAGNWPQIAGNASGDLAATWSITSGANPRVQAAVAP